MARHVASGDSRARTAARLLTAAAAAVAFASAFHVAPGRSWPHHRVISRGFHDEIAPLLTPLPHGPRVSSRGPATVRRRTAPAFTALGMANEKSGSESEEKSGGGRFGKILGAFGVGGDGDDKSKKSKEKRARRDKGNDDLDGEGEGEGGVGVGRFARRLLQRGSKDEDDQGGQKRSNRKKKRERKRKEKGRGGVELGINEFVGPRFPINSEVGLRAELEKQQKGSTKTPQASKSGSIPGARSITGALDAVSKLGVSTPQPAEPETEQERKQRVRAEMQEKRMKQLEAQAKAREEAKKKAMDKARKLGEEQKEKERKQKEAMERQSAVRRAASGKNAEKRSGLASLGMPSKAPVRPPDEDKTADSGRKLNAGAGGVVGNALSSASSFVSGLRQSIFKDDESEWIVVCPKTRISPGEVVPVVVGGLDLLVVASRDGKKVHAIQNSCPHLGTPLETGLLEARPKLGSDPKEGCMEDCIICPLHNTAFELESGEVQGEWCPYPPIIGKVMGAVKPKTNLLKFDIRTKGKNIEVRINTPLEDKGKSQKTLKSR